MNLRIYGRDWILSDKGVLLCGFGWLNASRHNSVVPSLWVRMRGLGPSK